MNFSGSSGANSTHRMMSSTYNTTRQLLSTKRRTIEGPVAREGLARTESVSEAIGAEDTKLDTTRRALKPADIHVCGSAN